MIVGISQIYLYTGLTPTGGNNSALALQWLDANNIQYQHLWYGEPSHHEGVFAAMNTWEIGTFTDFPFVTYEELHDDNTSVTRALIGLDAITSSNLVELSSLKPS